jgi:hypothetical protein
MSIVVMCAAGGLTKWAFEGPKNWAGIGAKTGALPVAALAALRWALTSREERQEVGRAIAPLGGKRRAEALTAKRRSEIAKKAAAARWGQK